MSLPFYDIKCTKCAYQERYSFNVSYQYQGELESSCEPCLTQGWCEVCQKILTIYTPQTPETVKHDVDIFTEYLNDEIAKRGTRHWIFKSLNADESLITHYSKKIKELNECVEFFEKKQLPKRCLTCGSDNVAEIKLPSNYNQPMYIGIKHYCGGDIIIEMSGRFSFGNLPKVIYDVYGNIIHDER